MIAYDKSIERLGDLANRIEEAVKFGNRPDEIIKELSNYTLCYYCQTYRASLTEHGNGYCDTCPLHQHGKRVACVADRPYNGCYLIGCYREAVKAAIWYSQDPAPEVAMEIVTLVRKVIDYMVRHKEEIDG